MKYALASVILALLVLAQAREAQSQVSQDVRPVATMSFDHVLSIYEWRANFLYSDPWPFRLASNDLRPKDAAFDSVGLTGKSRFLQDNSITSSEATGFINWELNLGSELPFDPFVMFFASSYLTSALPGLSTSSFITHQTDGFGIVGLRSHVPQTDIALSAGGGIARQSQPELSTYGGMVRGEISAPMETLSENTSLSSSLLADERFYNARSQRYSNDRLVIRAVSSLLGTDDRRPSSPIASGVSSAGVNVAQLNAGLLRRDYFFASDSNSGAGQQAIKQERTEYSLLLSDSLSFPVAEEHLAGNASLEFEPKSIVRRSDASESNLFSTPTVSTLSSLLAPNEVASLRLAASGRLDYELDPARRYGAEAQIRYEERSENVRLLASEIAGTDPAFVSKLTQTLDQASYSARSTAAGVSIHLAPSLRDMVHLESNIRLLNYDTPSDLNADDHDELVTSADLRYNKVLSDELAANVDITASRTHLVYLRSDRSSQNNITQSLSFGTDAFYAAPTLLTHVHAEIFVNYTVLDYLNSLPSLQAVGNYLLRGITVSDSIAFPLGLRPLQNEESLTLEEGLTLRVSERGSYNETAFSERRDAQVTELGAAVLLGIASKSGRAPWNVRLGARGFLLSQSGRSVGGPSSAALFTELQRQTRIGPMFLLSLLRSEGKGPELTGSIWYAWIRSQSYDLSSYSRSAQMESHISVQWAF